MDKFQVPIILTRVTNRKMREAFEKMKNMTLCDNMVTIKSTMKEADVAQMEALADELLA